MTYPPRRRALALAIWALAVGLTLVWGADPGYWPPRWVPSLPHMWREVWISITLLTVEIAALYLVLTSERLGTKRRILISLGICLAGLTLDTRWGSTHQSGAAYTNGYFLLLVVIALLVAAGRTTTNTSSH